MVRMLHNFWKKLYYSHIRRKYENLSIFQNNPTIIGKIFRKLKNPQGFGNLEGFLSPNLQNIKRQFNPPDEHICPQYANDNPHNFSNDQ